jgi:apoptosis-inducing factor 3
MLLAGLLGGAFAGLYLLNNKMAEAETHKEVEITFA